LALPTRWLTGHMVMPLLERLDADPLWAREYEDFIRAVAFAAPQETIGFFGNRRGLSPAHRQYRLSDARFRAWSSRRSWGDEACI